MRFIRLLPLLLTRYRKEVLLFWRVVTHRATPLPAKLLALLAVLYVISPVDLIPNFIPILGWLDDVGVVALVLNIAYRLLPAELHAARRAGVYGGPPTVPHTGPRAKR